MISSAKCCGRRDPPSRERQDPVPPAVLAGQSIWPCGWLESILPSPSDPHMRNDCPSPAPPILGFPLKQDSSKQSLHCQRRRHETATARTARQRWGSKETQSCRSSGSMGGRQRGSPVPKTPICPRDHLLWGDKSSPQWSSCRAFRHWQDKRVGRPEILLAKPEKKRQELCPRMWRLSDFKGCPPQALWRPTVLTCTNSSIEGPLHGLCDRLTVVFWLERRQLWLDSRHCRPIDQDDALRTSQNHHRCSWTSGINHRRGGAISRPPRLHHK